MMNKNLIIIFIIILSACIAFFMMRGTLTPYVPFEKAMKSGSSVQVIGKLDKSKEIIHKEGSIIFNLKEETGKSMAFRYNGIKPANFENADQVVAIGTYNRELGAFEAEQLLVKCPSKYVKSIKSN